MFLAILQGDSTLSLKPANFPRTGVVDERFQSYNVEMLEVTGGSFWKPYRSLSQNRSKPTKLDASVPAGMDPSLYEYRPPIDLSMSRLRKLAAALGPAYVRVSGTWANTSYFQDSPGPASKTPPRGFNGVLTQKQWKGVIDFSKAVNAKIVTSFATSPGTRNSDGVWTPKEADKFLAYTRSVGGSIAAAEYMNEPTYAAMGGAPKGYDAASYGRDVAVFRPYIKKTAPEIIFLGPGSVGEGGALAASEIPMLHTKDLLIATGDVFDAFSYHFYGAASNRCAQAMPSVGTTADAALTPGWLSQTDTVETYYAKLRDQFLPGKPLWVTETADAACGGNPWASTFMDSFRYLNQLGTLAQRGVQVVIHNTLASSDYGLLDENSYTPRPNFWAAVLWRRLMGTTVLQPEPSPSPDLRLYAHCLRGVPGGVSLLVINASRTAPRSLTLPTAVERYTLTAQALQSTQVKLNGNELQLAADDALPSFTAVPTTPKTLTFAPTSITFLAIPNADNNSCR
jgi:heparanase